MEMEMETEIFEILPSTRYCFVPSCSNNSAKERNMVFVAVKNSLKEDWCRLLNRKCSTCQLYCCEIHLDLDKDLENYDKWKMEGGYPIMSKNATLKRIPIERKPTELSSTTHFQISPVFKEKCDKMIQVKPICEDKSTYKTTRIMNQPRSNLKRKFEIVEMSTTPAPSGSSYECEATETSTSAIRKNTLVGRKTMLNLVEQYPLMYIGVPKNYFWIIDYIIKFYDKKTTSLNIIVTLFKLRQGDTVVRISHQFQICRKRIVQILHDTTPLLSSALQNFIVSPPKISLKNNLPYAFKIKYSNVIMIIDCFEIGIEKPSNPVRQAQSWSSYKSCNTIKYLVGAAPSGFITFISKGFGGRITDKAIAIESGLIDHLPINSVVMADRGFKEIESHLATKNIKLLRPPSVYSNIKPSKEQVRESKIIASLRIHIERVIKRLREFRILKPHSVINHQHVPYLDEYVTIACGLCNLQMEIIKEE